MVSVFPNHILNEYATKLNVRKNFVLSICSMPTDFLLEKKIEKKERRHVSHVIIGNLLFFFCWKISRRITQVIRLIFFLTGFS